MKKTLGAVFMCSIMACSLLAENQPETKDTKYDEMVKSALVGTGNNYRLKTVIEKIKKGKENVYIAAIGGSVTEGAGPADFRDGYAYQFFKAVKSTFAPDGGKKVYFNNAGLSGTPSLLGKLRYQTDVVEVLGHEPDLLIVEFAVNDGGEEVFNQSFEGIVRDALLANPECAVIALYSAATYGNTAANKKKVASHYQISQIDMLPVVNDAIKNGTFKKEDYYADYVHPTKYGHTLMSDSLLYLLKTVDNAKKDKKVNVPSETAVKKALTNVVRILDNDDNVKITKGNFDSTDASCQTLKKTNKSDFPVNWHKKQNSSSSEPLVLNLKCKAFILTYKVQGNWMSEKFGKAEVYVDGKLAGTYDGGAEGGWNNCEARVLFNGTESREHKIEVKMHPDSEKLGFTIVAMGYIE